MFKPIYLMFFLFASTFTHAALIDYDDYTRDATNGLDWLDLDFTEGLSYNAILAEITTGSLQEWRFATSFELEDMVSYHLGFQVIQAQDNAQYNGMIDLVGLFDATYGIGDPDAANSNYAYTVGFVDSSGEPEANAMQFGYTNSNGNLGYFRPSSSTIWDADFDDVNTRRGAFLVRATQVAEPSLLTLVLLAFISLVVRTRKS